MSALNLVYEKTKVLPIINVVVFTLLMIVSALIRIPLFFSPVPVTAQTLVLFLSLVFLRKQAYLPQVLYLGLGSCGFAVFTLGGAGLFYLLGPTGGYLLGFLAVALIMPRLMPEMVSLFKAVALFALASVIVYIFGASWLVGVCGFKLDAAFFGGVLPFIPGDLVKIFIAAVVYARLAMGRS